MTTDTKSQKSRKVAVLGPIPRDEIVTDDGERFEKYGCALYTAVALSALLDAGDTIVLVSHVRRDDEGPLKQILAPFPNIDSFGITSSADQGDGVELRYTAQNSRVERQTSFMNPILPADVAAVLDADAFVCVPITDYEVGQATLRHIKEHSGATIVLDAHGPTTTLTRGGERRPRVWADQDIWLPYVDILKMNLDEAHSMWLGESGETTADPPKQVTEEKQITEELRDLAHHCLGRGVGALCVTLDEHGCVSFSQDGSGGVTEEFIDPVPVEHVVDTTGAGDSFAAGLAYGYLAYRNYVVACQYGNAMGAQRCTGPGTDLNVYLPREETERQIRATYGPGPYRPGA
ncbi:MAG TPA: carbohydrate kinase family protein [Trebonia sp.]|nr:carbohydrate kinase family protein [Trebonia sp.]